MSKRQKKTLVRLGTGLALFLFAVLFPAEMVFGEAAGRYIFRWPLYDTVFGDRRRRALESCQEYFTGSGI